MCNQNLQLKHFYPIRIENDKKSNIKILYNTSWLYKEENTIIKLISRNFCDVPIVRQ